MPTFPSKSRCSTVRRLASYICGHEVFQISVSSTYGLADFRENLLRLYTKVTARLTVMQSSNLWTRVHTVLQDPHHRCQELLFIWLQPLLNAVWAMAGGQQGPACGTAHDGQSDRERGVPRVHQRPPVNRLHPRPLHAGKHPLQTWPAIMAFLPVP